MNKYYGIIILLVLTGTTTFAQTDEAAVTSVIHTLFTGMEKGDSAMVHSAFGSNVTMATALRDKSNNPVLRRESSINDFLKAVGTPHKDVWYEEIWNIKVQIDGDFAQAWCDYAFYLNNTFSHCGIDAFHLHKTASGWKIFHLADTRRKEPCVIPAEVRKKHGGS